MPIDTTVKPNTVIMTTNPPQYDIIVAETPDSLVRLVNEKLNEGWLLYQGPFTNIVNNGCRYYQPMLKPSMPAAPAPSPILNLLRR